MKKNIASCLSVLFFIVTGCHHKEKQVGCFISENIDHAVKLKTLQTNYIEDSGLLLNPRTVKDKSVAYVSYKDWTSGFFPGSIWYLYDLTKKEKWLRLAKKYTEGLDSAQYLTTTHDVGFMIGCSFLNGFRQGEEGYKSVIIQAARSLSSRFHANVGIIQSWDVDKGWMSLRGWKCPVIIDNMMNLELLFEAAILADDSSFYDMAVSHADKTLSNHYRPDFSSYHVVDYDPATGAIRTKETAQGYSNESAWARGQAWGLYGYTMCYRYTKDPAYLEHAANICNFIFTHSHLPKDLIPYWDYNALNIPNEPRDASAAAITASALYELSTYMKEGDKYKKMADCILHSLAGNEYRARENTNGNFILMHCVGSIPHNEEIDAPLNYADYYFLESLVRKKRIEEDAESPSNTKKCAT